MAFLLEVVGGPCQGKRFRIEPGERLVFGRSRTVDRPLSEDSFLSKRHFGIECRGDTARLWDEGSRNGTYLNGAPVTDTVAGDGAEISAGNSFFRLRFEGAAEAVEDGTHTIAVPSAEPEGDDEPPVAGRTRLSCATPAERHGLIRRLLMEEGGALYAIVDGARGPEMPAKIFELEDDPRYLSLFFGTPMNELVSHAPYLVRLEPGSRLFQWWLDEGWGNAWGILLLSDAELETLHAHFQELLIVQDEEGRELYFRYFDARVMEIYWPTCTDEESHKIFCSRGALRKRCAEKSPIRPALWRKKSRI